MARAIIPNRPDLDLRGKTLIDADVTTSRGDTFPTSPEENQLFILTAEVGSGDTLMVPGFYQYDGADWVAVASGAGGGFDVTVVDGNGDDILITDAVQSEANPLITNAYYHNRTGIIDVPGGNSQTVHDAFQYSFSDASGSTAINGTFSNGETLPTSYTFHTNIRLITYSGAVGGNLHVEWVDDTTGNNIFTRTISIDNVEEVGGIYLNETIGSGVGATAFLQTPTTPGTSTVRVRHAGYNGANFTLYLEARLDDNGGVAVTRHTREYIDNRITSLGGDAFDLISEDASTSTVTIDGNLIVDQELYVSEINGVGNEDFLEADTTIITPFDDATIGALATETTFSGVHVTQAHIDAFNQANSQDGVELYFTAQATITDGYIVRDRFFEVTELTGLAGTGTMTFTPALAASDLQVGSPGFTFFLARERSTGEIIVRDDVVFEGAVSGIINRPERYSYASEDTIDWDEVPTTYQNTDAAYDDPFHADRVSYRGHIVIIDEVIFDNVDISDSATSHTVFTLPEAIVSRLRDPDSNTPDGLKRVGLHGVDEPGRALGAITPNQFVNRATSDGGLLYDPDNIAGPGGSNATVDADGNTQVRIKIFYRVRDNVNEVIGINGTSDFVADFLDQGNRAQIAEITDIVRVADVAEAIENLENEINHISTGVEHITDLSDIESVQVFEDENLPIDNFDWVQTNQTLIDGSFGVQLRKSNSRVMVATRISENILPGHIIHMKPSDVAITDNLNVDGNNSIGSFVVTQNSRSEEQGLEEENFTNENSSLVFAIVNNREVIVSGIPTENFPVVRINEFFINSSTRLVNTNHTNLTNNADGTLTIAGLIVDVPAVPHTSYTLDFTYDSGDRILEGTASQVLVDNLIQLRTDERSSDQETNTVSVTGISATSGTIVLTVDDSDGVQTRATGTIVDNTNGNVTFTVVDIISDTAIEVALDADLTTIDTQDVVFTNLDPTTLTAGFTDSPTQGFVIDRYYAYDARLFDPSDIVTEETFIYYTNGFVGDLSDREDVNSYTRKQYVDHEVDVLNNRIDGLDAHFAQVQRIWEVTGNTFLRENTVGPVSNRLLWQTEVDSDSEIEIVEDDPLVTTDDATSSIATISQAGNFTFTLDGTLATIGGLNAFGTYSIDITLQRARTDEGGDVTVEEVDDTLSTISLRADSSTAFSRHHVNHSVSLDVLSGDQFFWQWVVSGSADLVGQNLNRLFINFENADWRITILDDDAIQLTGQGAESIIDQSDGITELREWTGTLAEYTAIAAVSDPSGTVDSSSTDYHEHFATTLYDVTDDIVTAGSANLEDNRIPTATTSGNYLRFNSAAGGIAQVTPRDIVTDLNTAGGITASDSRIPSSVTDDYYPRFNGTDGTLEQREPADVRADIGAGTSNLELGSTGATAAAGDHNHDINDLDGTPLSTANGGTGTTNIEAGEYETLDGVTSNIQDQLNTKLSAISLPYWFGENTAAAILDVSVVDGTGDKDNVEVADDALDTSLATVSEIAGVRNTTQTETTSGLNILPGTYEIEVIIGVVQTGITVSERAWYAAGIRIDGTGVAADDQEYGGYEYLRTQNGASETGGEASYKTIMVLTAANTLIEPIYRIRPQHTTDWNIPAGFYKMIVKKLA